MRAFLFVAMRPITCIDRRLRQRVLGVWPLLTLSGGLRAPVAAEFTYLSRTARRARRASAHRALVRQSNHSGHRKLLEDQRQRALGSDCAFEMPLSGPFERRAAGRLI